MEIFQIVILAVVATLIIMVLKVQRPEIALQISIITGVIIFFVVLGKTSAVIELLKTYADKANIDTVYFSTLLKIIGIAYIAEFGSEICKDAGESAIASKVELAGKVIIIVLAVPIVTSLLDLVIEIMP
ncbi:MAG TPA: stage III sporulation protein AD [Ruminiclostridium sp.]|jgi:stage III sporulation protein AD|uniref:Stage III sporulation protein AC/AD protein family protein n=1 Tax=Acetivibrio saccincola TaxID=1677857 RepID=A0A2K9EQA3_9FIRM|nr:stage III sporulation protein AD [Acetivibrio saccincola]HAA43181.1 stage III sporulation protein AD [Ruminiclostridium sp.]AUG57670.1 Stage III sporulation protein AC/AD protein family protein [Acetivibrio saccincola]NLW26511.1 stage III sporulation protein AD [Acetivibrio saccincola]PQQ67565.1 stage III sporulation protein AD [Acetivibrio saccincola]HOA98201.1 stage III sporulation protein AD [Acetivibrio saccincola]